MIWNKSIVCISHLPIWRFQPFQLFNINSNVSRYYRLSVCLTSSTPTYHAIGSLYSDAEFRFPSSHASLPTHASEPMKVFSAFDILSSKFLEVFRCREVPQSEELSLQSSEPWLWCEMMGIGINMARIGSKRGSSSGRPSTRRPTGNAMSLNSMKGSLVMNPAPTAVMAAFRRPSRLNFATAIWSMWSMKLFPHVHNSPVWLCWYFGTEKKV